MKSYKSHHSTIAKALATLLLLGGLSTAQGETISDFDAWSTALSVNESPTNLRRAGSNIQAEDIINFDQFDSSLGTLTGVNLTLSNIRFGISYSASFRDPDFAGATAGEATLTNINLYLETDTNLISSLEDQSGTCSSTFGTSSCSINRATTGFDGRPSSVDFSIDNLSPFIGSGPVSFEIIQFAQIIAEETDGDNDRVVSYAARVSTSGDARITYTYSPVPLPASAWLFGSALLGFVGLKRKAK